MDCNSIDDDEIEICQNVEPHGDESSIKSKAVFKFAAVQDPANFTRLQCNTNLNMPPSNWLSNSPNTFGLHQALYHSPGFSSFRMAHMFPDCLGEVDAISDAENIKKLLKLPYAPKTTISMMIHKVGNTLLIDEFDVQKYLLRKADDDWKWLRTFILENILNSLSGKDRNFCLRDKSRRALQRKNLLSKFLYHSVQQSSSADNTTTTTSNNTATDFNDKNRPILHTGPLLPEPSMEQNVPDPKQTNHVFNRNVIWTFEDIRMLVGTDMPIFGGGTRPCISLRLRDMTKPINVLTGIDYWLDNLMCNVPEVVMCYHLDGIVQKYELIKTEDLPYLEDSKFSSQVIRNVAQNILAFLKVNATKAGHTYWLFKGKNDEVVKLYDLTTLCKNSCDNNDEKYENPFTVPVAMLLYTVARNIKNSSKKLSPKKAGSIKTLLYNCIKLLPKEKFPQIVISSHYILSDLYVPFYIDPKKPNFDSEIDSSDVQSVCDDDYNVEFNSPLNEDIENNDNDNVAVKSIHETLKEFNNEYTNWKSDQSPLPLTATIEERCKISIQHISIGLDCLKYIPRKELSRQENGDNNNHGEEDQTDTEKIFHNDHKEEEKRKILYEEQHLNMAKSFQSIPMPYQTLKSSSSTENMNNNIISTKQHEEKSNKENKKHNKKNKDSKKNKIKNQEDEISSSSIANENKVNDINDKIMIYDTLQKFGTWNVHLKLLLLEKACLIYTTIAEHNYTLLENYGTCLKYICMAYRCHKIIIKNILSTKCQKSLFFARAGDCFFQIARNWQNSDTYIEQYQEMSKEDEIISSQIGDEDQQEGKCNEIPELLLNIEYLLLSSCKCYKIALESDDSQSRIELLRRLGSVKNELGLKYMKWSEEEYANYAQTVENEGDLQRDPENECMKQERKLYEVLIKKSYDSLVEGIALFNKTDDSINLAFLLCNMGRLMRFKAHISSKENKEDDLKLQSQYYNLSFRHYQEALNILKTRKQNPELWDIISWELSTAMFTLAVQIQDFIDKDEREIPQNTEREIVDLLQKSLKLCDVTDNCSKYDSNTYRKGLIHYRLGSLNQNLLRRNKILNDKTTLQLCRFHYDKALMIFKELGKFKDILLIQIERIALQEFLANDLNYTKKIKSLQTALEICVETKSVFDYAINSKNENLFEQEMLELTKNFFSRLQFILRTLTKLCSTRTSSKQLVELEVTYKSMYSLTLGIQEITDQKKYFEQIVKVLEKIK